MFEISRLTRLDLGYQGENRVRTIEIDVGEWLDKWPGAHIGILVQRPFEEDYYPAAVVQEGSKAKWTVTRADVEIAGDGIAQVKLLTDADEELRSKIVRTQIHASMPGTLMDVPEAPAEEIVNQTITAAAHAQEAQAGAEEARDEAVEAMKAAQLAAAPPILAHESGDIVEIVDASARDAVEVVTVLPVMQEGEGVPSEDNPRGVMAHSAMLLMHEAEYTDAPTPKHMVMLPEGMVYGGRYDWLTGTMYSEYAMIVLAGTGRSWNQGDKNFYTPIADRATNARIYCDSYVQVDSTVGMQPGQMALGARNGNVCFGTSLTRAEWIAKIDANPLHVVYELAEPVAIQMDPAKITMLEGSNALWCMPYGEMEVGYIVDTKTYVDSNGAQDGISPVANVTQTSTGAVITITDVTGTTSATIKNGADGKTPVKGTDYFTDDDKSEMVNAVIAALPVYGGETA